MSWGQNYFASTDWQEILPPKLTMNQNIIFNKAEIEEWLKSGTYRKSETDLENEAMAFINNKRYGRK